jgi:hypothetical protein
MISNHNVEDSNLYAILIGIDFYFPNSLYSSLGGCVRDISHVEDFLIRKIKGIFSNNILKLTCSEKKENTGKPTESEEKWPTYENMVNAFNLVTEKAKSGDQVYIHYSGHGGRVKTLLTDIKGSNGFDETIVPTDIGNPKSRHLRDIEIAALLRRMLDKKLIVTLVIDSCHSGGLTRGRGGAVVRGRNEEDKTSRPQDSLVASKEELEHIWKDLSSYSYISKTSGITTRRPTVTDELKSMTRGISASGWLPQPQGYVLLAACRPSESAYEYAFEGDERNGALTYWFLKSFEQMDKGLTYKIIHDRIVTKVHGQFPLQTPMLEGEGDREVFGTNKIRQVYAVSVMKVDISNNRILLNTGQAQGIKKSTRFAIYPFGISDFSEVDMRLGLVEIDERGATNSWAKIIKNFGRDNIKEGCQAILITPTDISLKKKVRLVYKNGDDTKSSTASSSSIPSIITTENQSLDKIRNFIMKKNKNNESFVELAPEDSDTAHFQVAVNENGQYVIWDPAGNDIPNLNPPLLTNNSNSVSKVIQRLEHLTKYSNIQLIDNIDAASDLYRKLVVELFKVPNDYEPGDRPSDLLPVESNGNMKIANVGQKLILRIKNMSEKVINTTILDLAPDWSISQVYPSSPGANFVPIDPNQEEFFYLDVDLPTSYNEGKDILKVFATLDQAGFRWLELPALDQPLLQQRVMSNRGGGGSEPISPLEQLMAAITNDKPITRNLNPSATPSKEWTTAQLEIKVYRQ